MTIDINNLTDVVLVAIDIAKARNDVLVQLPNGTKKNLKLQIR